MAMIGGDSRKMILCFFSLSYVQINLAFVRFHQTTLCSGILCLSFLCNPGHPFAFITNSCSYAASRLFNGKHWTRWRLLCVGHRRLSGHRNVPPRGCNTWFLFRQLLFRFVR
jgi:hypothetical protein